MAYDGSINIDSKIDSKGFNSGVKSMLASVAKIGVAIAAAFAVKLVTQFGASAVQEASKMASALTGLQSIVEGTGNSFRGAQDFIETFVADGLVPAQNAITAYKNLLLRGYDTSQIEKTLAALKDSAAFGRQGSLTLGQAVESATEGLKNENSILVDNAGVTKNVSVIWKEYADSIGTTVAALTKQQKIQAEVEGIMRETRFQTGDAAKLAGTYAGQVSALGVSFLNLKIAVGNAIIPFIQKILPYIRAAIDALTRFFNRLATIIGILFGVSITAQAEETAAAVGGTADAANEAADAQGNLADKTTKAGKAAKGALASFDQLNVLQQDTGGAGAAGAGAGADIPGAGGGLDLGGLDTGTFEDDLSDLREKVLKWKQDFITFFKPVTEAFDRLVVSLAPLGQTIWSGLQWAWENILKPLGEWAAQSLVPAVFDLIGAAVIILNDALVGLQPLGQWLWENFLQPLGEWTGETLVKAIQQITEWLQELHVWIGENDTAWQAILAVLAAVGIALFILTLPITGTTLAIAALVAGIIILIAYFDEIDAKFMEITESINNAGEKMRLSLKGVFEGIYDAAKNAINGVIDAINRALSGVTSAINTFSQIGAYVGLNIPQAVAPQIPHLATGAVIPPNAQFAAILGDQTSGRNIEAPEKLIRQIIQEEIGNVKADININFDGSMGELVRLLKPRIDRENVRIGKSLAKGTA